MSEAVIKPAAVADLTAIRELATLIWHAYYPAIVTREQIDYMLERMYALETLREELLNRGVRFDRLLLGDEFIGFASYGPTDAPLAWKLHKLYLLPAYHGKGLGSQLLRHSELQARHGGAQRLTLNVNKRNAQAIAAYQRNGFVVLESITLDIGGGFVMDDFVMVKPLA